VNLNDVFHFTFLQEEVAVHQSSRSLAVVVGQDQNCVNQGCNANDVRFGTIRKVGSQIECYPGEKITVALSAEVKAGAADRYDIGLFLHQTGGSAQTDAGANCVHAFLEAPGPPGDQIDDDKCLDIRASTTLTVPFSAALTCPISGVSGAFVTGGCTSWEQNKNTVCNSLNEARPGAPSKCSCDLVTIGNIVVLRPQLNIIKTATTTDKACPGTDPLNVNPPVNVKYCYTVTNGGNAPLYNVQLVDDNGTPSDTGDDFTVTCTGLTDIDNDGNADDLATGATANCAATKRLTTPNTTVKNIVTATGVDRPSGAPGTPQTLTKTDSATVIAGASTCDPSSCADQCNNGNCATGVCVKVPKTDGTECNDGLFCTSFSTEPGTTDKCKNGVCKGNPVSCPVDQSTDGTCH
jgi:hypothetical protein